VSRLYKKEEGGEKDGHSENVIGWHLGVDGALNGLEVGTEDRHRLVERAVLTSNVGVSASEELSVRLPHRETRLFILTRRRRGQEGERK
jgi:hypothetical protein